MQIELLERFHLNSNTEGFVPRTKVLKKTTTMTHSKSKKKCQGGRAQFDTLWNILIPNIGVFLSLGASINFTEI